MRAVGEIAALSKTPTNTNNCVLNAINVNGFLKPLILYDEVIEG